MYLGMESFMWGVYMYVCVCIYPFLPLSFHIIDYFVLFFSLKKKKKLFLSHKCVLCSRTKLWHMYPSNLKHLNYEAPQPQTPEVQTMGTIARPYFLQRCFASHSLFSGT